MRARELRGAILPRLMRGAGRPHGGGRRPAVTAVVLTHRRPRLAARTVRMLLEQERFDPRDVVVVVNGVGGLDDPTLESAVDVIRTGSNLGPAGGFAVGLRRAHEMHSPEWVYVCEDDVALLKLPTPRVESVIERARAAVAEGHPIGAVVAYGRRLDWRTGRSVPHVPGADELESVDVAAWGASLVHRSVLDANIFPDADLFFGYEDFDFFLAMQRAGFRVVVDTEAERAVAHQVTDSGRAVTFAGERPNDGAEQWRHYYRARNFIVLSRRYGRRRWRVLDLALSLRRWQYSGWSLAAGRAIVSGLRDGYTGRLGPHGAWQRTMGELSGD